jgi:hypothetical protein
MTDMREAVARALAKHDRIEICSDASYALSSYGPKADAALSLMQPEIDRRVAEERAKLLERLREPSDEMCVGLARDIMMWLDMDPKTPRALFKHLERISREIPQWLRDEPEMQSLDHVPSKATRCAIIWQAMMTAFRQENSDAKER